MQALFKTLFGDATTIACVAVVMAAEIGLVGTGYAAQAGLAIPPLVLAGVAWLARH